MSAVTTIPSSYPEEAVSHQHVELMRLARITVIRLLGKEPYPGEPADVTEYERAELWRHSVTISQAEAKWPSQNDVQPWYIFFVGMPSISGGAAFFVSFTVLAMVEISLLVLGIEPLRVTDRDIFVHVVAGSMAVSTAGGLAWGCKDWFLQKKRIAASMLFDTARAMKKGSPWHEKFRSSLRKLSANGTHFPDSIRRVAGLLESGKKLEKVVLPPQDVVLLMRLTTRLEVAHKVSVLRLVVEGETDELMARTFEALGGECPKECLAEMRV